MSNTYYTSDGIGISKPAIDQRIRRAKEEFIEHLRCEGKLYCDECGTTGDRLSVSHTISVNDAQKTRRTELAWDIDNFRLLCIPCHQKHDKLY